jgi:amino acid transporter
VRVHRAQKALAHEVITLEFPPLLVLACFQALNDTSSGVPIYCIAVTLTIALLSFLQVSTIAVVVLNWFVSLVTASKLINFSVIANNFILWKRACDAQGLGRSSVPQKSFWQPFSAYYALTGCFIMTFARGYTVFSPDGCSLNQLFSISAMIAFGNVLASGRPDDRSLLSDI